MLGSHVTPHMLDTHMLDTHMLDKCMHTHMPETHLFLSQGGIQSCTVVLLLLKKDMRKPYNLCNTCSYIHTYIHIGAFI